ncbi:MAG: hypothetical protein IKI65_06925, partial [Firmicutes bacterium]|nr:hypothetical protein [Bacillota bacterium]
YLVGNVIYEHTGKKEGAAAFFFLSFAFFLLTFFIRKKYGINRYLLNPYTSFFSPTITIASLLLFTGFSKLRLQTSFGNLPRLTFFIYLFHTFVFGVLLRLLGGRILISEPMTIFIVSATTFLISWLIAFFYSMLWKTR